MKLSVGVLLILNDKFGDTSAAVAFSRIWCAFEESSCVNQSGASRMLLDIASVSRNRKGEQVAHVLADGIAAIDAAVGFGGPKMAPTLKRKREMRFPITVVKQGLTLQLEVAQASNEDDRKHILNCLAGRDLDLPPLAQHEQYTKV